MILNIFRRSTSIESGNLVVRPPARPGVPMTKGPKRVVLITGASSGIGKVTAELLAARDHRVFGGVRAPATTRPLAGVEFVPLDVRDEASVKACVEEVRNRAGRIDVLINNAGINLVGAIEETSISQAQALFDTTRHAIAITAWNLFGAADLVLAIGFGVTSAEGSPLQIFPGPGSEAMQRAP